VWYAKGTLNSTATATATGQPDRSISYSGTERVTGGTSKFKHARGTYTITGTSAPQRPGHASVPA
jgi:hypothetical protein